ncbi:MAG: hypothetical protein ACT4OE_09860 [Sphingosinicella sp.]
MGIGGKIKSTARSLAGGLAVLAALSGGLYALIAQSPRLGFLEWADKALLAIAAAVVLVLAIAVIAGVAALVALARFRRRATEVSGSEIWEKQLGGLHGDVAALGEQVREVNQRLTRLELRE